MDIFMEALKNITLTANGGFAFKSTGNHNADFFSAVDRHMSKTYVANKMNEAINEDPTLAFLNLIYLRDIERGKGVRSNFRLAAQTFLIRFPQMLEPLFKILVDTKIGRADDLHYILSEENRLQAQYAELLKNNLSNGLVCKWLPTKGSATNKVRTARANKLAKLWKLTPKQYRQLVVGLRKGLDLPETRVCTENFDNIDYSKIPSLAMLRYNSIFARKDTDNFQSFMAQVKSGKAKLNTGTLSPVDLVASVLNFDGVKHLSKDEIDYVNTAWELFERPTNPKKTLVVADVSGSMFCCNARPIATSIAAALYTSEILPEPFKNTFITFSNSPEIVEVVGKNIVDKIDNISKANWGMDTNLKRVFDLILSTAQHSSDMVDRLLIVSDMHINSCCDTSIITHYKEEFANKGFKLPEVVFWNVNADTFQIGADEEGVALISGESTGIFNTVLNAEIPTPYKFMMQTLTDTYKQNQLVLNALELLQNLIKF